MGILYEAKGFGTLQSFPVNKMHGQTYVFCKSFESNWVNLRWLGGCGGDTGGHGGPPGGLKGRRGEHAGQFFFQLGYVLGEFAVDDFGVDLGGGYVAMAQYFAYAFYGHVVGEGNGGKGVSGSVEGKVFAKSTFLHELL